MLSLAYSAAVGRQIQHLQERVQGLGLVVGGESGTSFGKSPRSSCSSVRQLRVRVRQLRLMGNGMFWL